MPQRLLIRLAPDGGVSWLALSREGQVLDGEHAGWPAQQPADETVVLVPAEDVLVLPVPDLPGSLRQRLQALPFAIEEQLAAPVEQQHVVLVQDPAAVLVVARGRLEAWLERCREAGIQPDRMLPDAWLLPPGPVLLVHDGRALLRLGSDRVLACPATQLDEHLALLAAAGSAPTTLQVWHTTGDAAPLPGSAVRLAAADGADEAAAVRSMPALLPALAPGLSATGANLLQGSYAPAHRDSQSLRRWRAAALLAAVAVLAWLGFALADHRALSQVAAAQQAEMETLYRSVVPGPGSVADPVARLRSVAAQRAGAAGGEGALAMLALVAPVIAGSGRHTVDAIEYRGGALELTLRSSDVATLDSLRARLDALPPLQAELTAATPGTAGVEGRLRVSRRSGA